MRLKSLYVQAFAAFASLASGTQIDISNPASVKGAASKVAKGLIDHWFLGEQAAITAGFQLPASWYWWESGELWTGMVDYWSYTGDSTFLLITHNYLQAQMGGSQNWMLESHRHDEANDDQAHWGLAAMTATEKGFPAPVSGSWLESVMNMWQFQVTQWDDVCQGGLRWGIEREEAKYTYKNTITNGAFFQLSARLATYTGRTLYCDWAIKSFEWAQKTGSITSDYQVLDGLHTDNCTELTTTRWSINHGIYLYGAAVMYKQTGLPIWKQHVDGLLAAASSYYFSAPGGKTVVWEPLCDRFGDCNEDQKIFKSSLVRYMYETAVMAPHTSAAIFKLMGDSAKGAANACVGDSSSVICGSKWYEANDGAYGPAAQLAALEVIQGMLLKGGSPAGNAGPAKLPPAPSNIQAPHPVDAPHSVSAPNSPYVPPPADAPRPPNVLHADDTPHPGYALGPEDDPHPVDVPLPIEVQQATLTLVSAKPTEDASLPQAPASPQVQEAGEAQIKSAIGLTTVEQSQPTTIPKVAGPYAQVANVEAAPTISGHFKLETTHSPSHFDAKSDAAPSSDNNEIVGSTPDSEKKPSGTKPKTHLSSEHRHGPSFALFLFCIAFLWSLNIVLL